MSATSELPEMFMRSSGKQIVWGSVPKVGSRASVAPTACILHESNTTFPNLLPRSLPMPTRQHRNSCNSWDAQPEQASVHRALIRLCTESYNNTASAAVYDHACMPYSLLKAPGLQALLPGHRHTNLTLLQRLALTQVTMHVHAHMHTP